MTHDLEIRLARPHEVPVLPSIETKAATLFDQVGLIAHGELAGIDLPTFRHALDRGLLWVAAERSRPVGFALAEELDEGRGADVDLHLRELDVHPGYGRQGLGRRLLEAVLRTATERGYPCITLTTFRHVPWNAPFYEKHGFRELPEPVWSLPLARIVAAEKAAGLDWAQRLVMVRGL